MFQIQITEVGTKEEVVKEWQKLSDDAGAEHQYGYVQTKNEVEDNKVIFFQEVEEFNLVSVIDAVNKKPVKEKKS